ncbi:MULTISPECIES: site-specific integrase [Epilithonimonas]|uniref:Integrase n=1 Tax=Epilithonimonas hispanica TaxID=358687 RepID=A0A3D9CVX0_9FLAO|nr:MULTISPECIES: site-specific integrase [Epilithonimonas]REC69777.1 integrase [Epilithonimonas hispanica]
MSSITAILRKKPNKQGQYPIYIRITKDRKSSFIALGYYIEIEQWDEKNKKVRKSHPNSSRLNNLIAKRISEAGGKLIEADASDKNVSLKAIRKKIINKGSDFFVVAEEYLKNIERLEKYNALYSEKPKIAHFKEFLNCKTFPIEQIDVRLLNEYQAYLKVERKVSDRTIANHLITIRTIYNIAIKEGIVNNKNYPFGRESIRIKIPESIKQGLSQEEVRSIEDLNLKEGSKEWHTRNIWLFSFYLAGIRVADVLKTKWSDFNNNRFTYRMGKNKKIISLKTPEKILQIISHYESQRYQNNGYVFPELKNVDEKNIKEVIRAVKTAGVSLNFYLKRIAEKAEINKPLSMHIARHTFGNISGDKIPTQMLQKLYRHSSITTTVNYQSNFIHKDVDDALEKVIDF